MSYYNKISRSLSGISWKSPDRIPPVDIPWKLSLRFYRLVFPHMISSAGSLCEELLFDSWLIVASLTPRVTQWKGVDVSPPELLSVLE